MNSSYQCLTDIKHSLLSSFPTKIRRSVCLSNVIAVDHSVNKWLYERWLINSSVEIELKSLHREMVQQITDHLDTTDVHIEFVHLDPRTTKHARESY
jgi:hypothetical protein